MRMSSVPSPLFSHRIDFAVHDHGFGDLASLAEGIDLRISVRESIYQLLQLLVEEAGDQFRRVLYGLAIVVGQWDLVAMCHALRDH